ncbi:MAG TPA: MBL fold metallo-hydrolase [Kofleriaceae bacterium]|nr:MBL fold metallo-hydrolase [Kofleriaceae bacterium]
MEQPRKRILLALTLSLAGCSTWPAAVRKSPPPPPITIEIPGPSDATLTVRRIGHASVLLESGGERVLTDPWFTEKSGYHHGEELALGVADLPPLTAVVSSHGHYDHYDMKGFAPYRDKTVPIVVRKGTAGDARKAGFTHVTELEPWHVTRAGGVTITAAPGKHGVDENTYIIELNGFTIFFGGDSLLIPAHQEIPKRFPRIDLALVSVNGLTVMGSPKVMNPKQAAKLCQMLKPAVAVPIHYRFNGGWFMDTFFLGYHGSPAEFQRAAATDCPSTPVRVLETGQQLVLTRRAIASAGT